ncbi:MAG: type II secretion system protein [Pseudomonadales bacterium]
MNIKHSSQNGFTLIELLVVISVLAAMAGIAVTAIDSYDGEARDQLARVEMNNIANAIYRFQQDTGYFPHEGVFADTTEQYYDDSDLDETEHALKEVRYERSSDSDIRNFSFLFDKPTKCRWDTSVTPNKCATKPSSADIDYVKILPWKADIARGWHGPYLTQESQRRLQNSDCDLDSVILTPSSSFSSLEDTFERSKTYSDTDSCFAIYNKGQWVPRTAAGMPYQYRLDYFKTNNLDCPGPDPLVPPVIPPALPQKSCVALISAGKDSIFNSDDDIVTILRKNG